MKNIEINYQSENSYRGKAVFWLLEKGVPIHSKLNANRVAWNLSSDDFLKFTPGSLGNTLGQFYKSQQFEPIPKAERHDVFHVLFDFSTNVIDEAAMQFFLWGNGKPSFLQLVLASSQRYYSLIIFKNLKQLIKKENKPLPFAIGILKPFSMKIYT